MTVTKTRPHQEEIDNSWFQSVFGHLDKEKVHQRPKRPNANPTKKKRPSAQDQRRQDADPGKKKMPAGHCQIPPNGNLRKKKRPLGKVQIRKRLLPPLQ